MDAINQNRFLAFVQTSSLASTVYRFENSSFSRAFVLKRSIFNAFTEKKENVSYNIVLTSHFFAGISLFFVLRHNCLANFRNAVNT